MTKLDRAREKLNSARERADVQLLAAVGFALLLAAILAVLLLRPARSGPIAQPQLASRPVLLDQPYTRSGPPGAGAGSTSTADSAR